jgi:hypothetical protein
MIAPSFAIAETNRGIPLHYVTTYSNKSGYYGPFIPLNSGLKWSTLVTDYCIWTVLLFVIFFIPKLLFKKHKKPENELRERLSH